MRLHFGPASADSLGSQIVGIHGHTPADQNDFRPGLVRFFNQGSDAVWVIGSEFGRFQLRAHLVYLAPNDRLKAVLDAAGKNLAAGDDQVDTPG